MAYLRTLLLAFASLSSLAYATPAPFAAGDSNRGRTSSSSTRASSTASGSSASPTSTSPSGGCPSIWSTVAQDLQHEFNGCNNQARSAVRFAFHDGAGYSSKTPAYGPASGGADGSLLLSDEEIARPRNDPLQGFRRFMFSKYDQYKDQGVGAADLIQLASSIGLRTCSGPIVKTVVGRTDDSNAAPDGTLPAAFGAGSDYNTLLNLFQDKGFSATDLAALIGAHTISQAFAHRQDGIPPGGPQDSTPTKWDTNYFQQLHSRPRGVFPFQSDLNLSENGTSVGDEMARFGADLNAWNSAFSSAMAMMGLLGIPASTIAGFTDCTSLVQ